jgi:hypothetical protein
MPSWSELFVATIVKKKKAGDNLDWKIDSLIKVAPWSPGLGVFGVQSGIARTGPVRCQNYMAAATLQVAGHRQIYFVSPAHPSVRTGVVSSKNRNLQTVAVRPVSAAPQQLRKLLNFWSAVFLTSASFLRSTNLPRLDHFRSPGCAGLLN